MEHPVAPANEAYNLLSSLLHREGRFDKYFTITRPCKNHCGKRLASGPARVERSFEGSLIGQTS
jgi:hypothetical protein